MLGFRGATEIMFWEQSRRRRDWEAMEGKVEQVRTGKSKPRVRSVRKLLQTYKRKSPVNKIVTPALRAKVKYWLLNCCEQVLNSPHKRDVIFARDDVSGKIKVNRFGQRFKIAKKFYMKSTYSVCKEATQPEEDGGCEGLTDADGNPLVSHRSFEKMFPHNFSRFKESHREDCICSTCQDATYMFEDLIGQQKRNYRELTKETKADKVWMEARPESHKNYDRVKRRTGHIFARAF